MAEEIAVVLTAKADQYHEEMRRAGLTAKQFDREMRNISNTLGKFSQTATKIGRSIALPAIALGAAAVKASVDFESAFAGVRKTVDATEEEFASLKKGLVDMSTEIPQTFVTLSQIAENAGQLGIAKENILSFTRTIADLAVTTNLTADQAAMDLARFANIMQMPQTEFDRLGSTVVDLGNKLATTEADIVGMALNISGAGKIVGMTEANVFSLAAGLSSVGIEAEAGGTAMSKTIVGIANAVATGGAKLDRFAKVAGMSAGQFAQRWQDDAGTTLVGFIEGLGKLNKAGGNVFATLKDLSLSDVRVQRALLNAANAGDVFRKSLEIGNKAWKDNIALTEEARKRYETTESQWIIFTNNVKAAAASFGDELVPMLTPYLEKLKDITKTLREMDPEQKKALGGMLINLTALGGSLWILGSLAGGLKNIIDLGKLLGVPKLLAWLTSAGTLAALGTVASVLGAIALAVGAIWAVDKTLKMMADPSLLPETSGAGQRMQEDIRKSGEMDYWKPHTVDPDVPKFHDGGVFRAPRAGGEGLALLSDGERVTPRGAGGITINITGNTISDKLDVRSIANEMVRQLKLAGVTV